MFWNDPNLYSVAFKDVPNVPPQWNQIPRYFNPYFNFTPYMNPTMFTPPSPFFHTPQFPQFPQFSQFSQFAQFPQIPQFPQVPQLPQFNMLDRTMTPYGYGFYRPFGL